MRLSRSELELEVLYRRITDGEIDLKPEYQRGEVWNRQRRSRLIDTILRNWYVPAIHLLSDSDSLEESVLDGQQRLAAIRDFFDDQLVIDGYTDPVSDSLQRLHGRRYSDLPHELQLRVRRFPITVVTLSDYEPDEPFELFFRLNQQAVLNPPEKRNALFGAARDQVRRIVETLVSDDLLSRSAIGFGNDRLAYDDAVSRAAFAIETHDLRYQATNHAIEDFYRMSRFSEETVELVLQGADRFLRPICEYGGVRQNKASLFSWIVAMAFVEPSKGRHVFQVAQMLREHKISSSDQLPLHEGDLASLLVPIFANRAAYRSNDIKSVILRDFIIHGLFEGYGFGISKFSNQVGSILDRFSGGPDRNWVASPFNDDDLYHLLMDYSWGVLAR